MKSEKTYDIAHMESIENNYKQCIDIIREAKKSMKDFVSVFNELYEGQTNKGMQEVVKVLTKHLDLYSECCENTAKYVNRTKEVIISLDKMQERSIQKLIKRE